MNYLLGLCIAFVNSYKDRDTNYSGFPQSSQDMVWTMVAP